LGANKTRREEETRKKRERIKKTSQIGRFSNARRGPTEPSGLALLSLQQGSLLLS